MATVRWSARDRAHEKLLDGPAQADVRPAHRQVARTAAAGGHDPQTGRDSPGLLVLAADLQTGVDLADDELRLTARGDRYGLHRGRGVGRLAAEQPAVPVDERHGGEALQHARPA